MRAFFLFSEQFRFIRCFIIFDSIQKDRRASSQDTQEQGTGRFFLELVQYIAQICVAQFARLVLFCHINVSLFL